MSAPILATKLYIPPPRSNLVRRPRLLKRLNNNLQRKLTLISAPAGFGKTTLVSEWTADCERLIAWLSLDEGDNDPTRFLVHIVAALQTIAPNFGAGVLAALHSSQPLTEAMLTVLLNEIITIPDHFILILDDYHVIGGQPVTESTSVGGILTFLLEHLPPQMHLVIATREDPPLPLARYRVRGQLTELRAADLRFTPTEAAEFLNQMMDLKLSVEDVAALETRTEGWIAGLQLAALALQGTITMQGHQDSTSFIQAFSGSHRFVMDYLVEEILQQQSDHVRSFLLQTSILDRLCGPLCVAVTGQGNGREMLEALERGNLFVVPLDDQRQWYRYHHLFADVLQTHLLEEQPQQVPGLHRRASVWYEQNDFPADAIRHALAAKDLERASDLVELAWSAMDISFQSDIWLGWVKTLPDELIRARPVLSAGYAWALLDCGEMEAAETRLQDAERWLDITTDMDGQLDIPSTKTGSEQNQRMVVVDKEQFRSLPASIATARAYRAMALDDISGAVQYAQQAFTLTPEGDRLRHTQATALLGVAQCASGDLETAERFLTDFQANLRKTGDILTIMGITFLLADIRITLGRLHEAESAYQQSLQLATSQNEPMPVGMADLYRGLSELYREWGNLEVATQYLLTSQKLGEQAALTDWQHRLCVAEARIKETQGDLNGALDRLDEAERVYIGSPLPNVRPIAALKARVWVRQGRLTKALGWVREQGLSVNDELSYLREFEYITLARVLIARYQHDQVDDAIHKAVPLLDRLLQAAEEGGRVGSVIEILALQALAHQAQGNIPLALTSLERALALAEPEGYIRIFVDEGLPMAALLQKAAKQGITSNYVCQLQATFGPAEGKTAVTQPLVEPLSERELEVLKLLGTELNGPEIARKLMVSLNTMRTHTKNIYSKLGVNNRRTAVHRAEELDLL